MSQINVNPPGERIVETVDTGGDRSAAAGINLITVLIVLAVLAVIAWYLFTGPLSGLGSSTSGGGQTNINVNPPSQSINVNPPSQPNAPAPGGSNSGGGSNSAAARKGLFVFGQGLGVGCDSPRPQPPVETRCLASQPSHHSIAHRAPVGRRFCVQNIRASPGAPMPISVRRCASRLLRGPSESSGLDDGVGGG